MPTFQASAEVFLLGAQRGQDFQAITDLPVLAAYLFWGHQPRQEVILLNVSPGQAGTTDPLGPQEAEQQKQALSSSKPVTVLPSV